MDDAAKNAKAMELAEKIRTEKLSDHEMSEKGKMAWRLGFFAIFFVTPAMLILISPFPPPLAAKHLITAVGGCTLGSYIGTAPAREDSPGYHWHLDDDGDGIACEQVRRSNKGGTVGMRAGTAKVIRH